MVCRSVSRQATAYWQWMNYLSAFLADDKPVLRVNLDESSLKLHVPSRPGLVFEPSAKRRRKLLRSGKGPSLTTRRSAVTLIAFACDNAEVQRVLPQVFVVSEHVVKKSDVEDLNRRCRGNMLFARRKSSWVNADFAAEVIATLAECLMEQLRSYSVVLLMDTLSSHLRVNVLKACGKAGIHVLFVPASTTAWLQPLDVAVFSVFKGWVVREIEVQRLASTDGLLTAPQMLDIYRRGAESVIRGRSWVHAFDLVGLRGQSKVSRRLLDLLELTSPLRISSELPRYQDFEAVLPAGRSVPLEDMFAAALAIEKHKERLNRVLKLKTMLRLPRSAKLP